MVISYPAFLISLINEHNINLPPLSLKLLQQMNEHFYGPSQIDASHHSHILASLAFIFSVSNQIQIQIHQRQRKRDHNMTNSEYQRTYSNMKSLTGTPNPESDSDGAKQVHDQRIVIPNKLITEAECINRKDQAWQNLEFI